MSKWKIACGAAILAAGLAPSAHADDFTKLTLLTFSAPVDVPGITLPAGTYRFELADPTTTRRVIRVSDKDGGKTYGMFLSIPNQRMKPADKPVVMFREAAAGAPPAVQVWFYPGETYGYEFAYPHDQALKIAKATHQSVLAYKDHSTASTTADERMASMKTAEIGRIDENDRPISADEALKDSSEAHTPVATTAAGSTTAPASSSASAAPTTAPASSSAAPTTAPASTTASNSRVAPASTTASASNITPASTTSSAKRATTAPSARNRTVGTSGTTSSAPASSSMTSSSASPAAAPAKPARKHLPKTASQLPLLMIFSGLSLIGGLGVRLARQSAV